MRVQPEPLFVGDLIGRFTRWTLDRSFEAVFGITFTEVVIVVFVLLLLAALS